MSPALEGGMDACSIVMDFIVPGIGGTLFEAVRTLGQLCYEMKENEALCRRVYNRLNFVLDELRKITDPLVVQQNRVLLMYSDAIVRFKAFLDKHSKKKLLMRLATNHKVAEELQSFHEEIDELFRLLSIAHMAEMSAWKHEWEEDKRKRDAEMQQLTSNTAQIVEELKGHSAQEEALTMLKHTIEHLPDSPEKELMKQTFFKCVQTSKTRIPKIPKWYIPRDDVDFEPEAFDCGSYGAVHRGKWGKGTKVVVKCLLMDGTKARESFLKETNIWFDLDHPHIIKLWGACHVGKPAFFVADDAIHGNFFDYFKVKEHKRRLWRLFYDAALGLHYLHEKKIVHGDLKCNNILVGADDKAKICDFGFSYIRSQSKGLSTKEQTDAIRWKGPECLEQDGHLGPENNARFASDIYSFGMCIYEAIAGEPPWGMMDDEEIMGMLDDGELPPRPIDMSDDAWSLIQRLCAHKYEDRLSMDEVIDELEKFVTMETEAEKALEHMCQSCQIVSQTKFCGNCGARLDSH